jgi:hypothetical protein
MAFDRDGFRAAAFRAGFRAGLFAPLRAFDFFAFFAMRPFSTGVTIRATMTRILSLASAIMITCAIAEPGAQQASVVGSWRLVSYDTQTTDGVKSLPLGQDLAGLAIYLPNGRVSIQFMRRDRPRVQSGDAWRGSLEEERRLPGFFSYAGRYTIDTGSVVTHHIGSRRRLCRDRSARVRSRVIG